MVQYENLVFPYHRSGNEYGCFNGDRGVFTAPINGRFEFGVYLQVMGGAGGYNYRIQLRRGTGGTTVQDVYASGTRDSGSYEDHRYFQFGEIDLNKNDTVYVTIISFSSGLRYRGGWSFIEGKLIKKNE